MVTGDPTSPAREAKQQRQQGERAWLAALVRALLILAGVTPWLPSLLSEVPVVGHLGTLVEAWFGFQCHRDPERALSFGSFVLPVCARCFGIYAGLGLGALVLRPRLAPKFVRVWLFGALVVMLLDVATELLDMRPPSAALRVGTGLILAWPIGVALVDSARRHRPAPSQNEP